MTVFRICFFICSLSIAVQANGQIAENDSASNVIVQIDAIEVPGRSAMAISQLNKIDKALLEQDELNNLISESQERLMDIDSIYETENYKDLSSFNRRHLLNKRSYWKQRQEQVESIVDILAAELDKLDSQRRSVQKIDKQWRSITQYLGIEAKDSIIQTNINRVYTKKNQLLGKLIKQESQLLMTQDQAITERARVLSLVDEIEQQINEDEDNVFARSPLAFNELFKHDSFSSVKTALKKNVKIEGQLVADYLKDHRANAFMFLVLLLSGIFAFRWVKKVIMRKGIIKNGSYYQQQFHRLLSDYKSTAFVIIIWLSALLFPNQPLLFKDIIRVVICIPLIILLSRLVDRRLFINILILFTLILIQLPFNLFPPNQIHYQVFIIIAALIEMVVLVNIRLYLLQLILPGKPLRSFINRFLIGVIGLLVVFSLMGIAGYTVLTELIVNTILTNTFSIALLFVSMLIAIGMIDYLFDSMRNRNLKVFYTHGASLRKRLVQAVVTVSVIMGVYIILLSIKLDDEVLTFIGDVLTYQFVISDTFSFSLGRIIMLIAILTLSIFTANVIKTILEEDVLSRTKLGQGLPHTIALLAKYTLITIGITLAVSMAGIPMTSLTVLIGAFGVGIGFGLQNIFNNLVSGLILLFERPIKIDDVIEVGQLLGRVKSIGIRSSIVRTFDGAEVIVPNGQLISNEVINWTHSDPQRRHEVIVGVAYGSNAEQVKQILEDLLHAHDDVLKDPEPSVLFINMGDSSLDFRLLFWISKVQEGLKIKSEITQMVYDALNQAGITIPFPQRDIHIISQPDKK
ncbi:mechanosensitive ion channel [Carboxylicivirga mesophila]|uniref:Mechanosensitive ion channel n=1 Tax=Carboxylicivirga mesophila TaxID=1166478 RepID=A0ABS5KCP0_9BACT|nr:mechanosensitive ion channel domain-containing protein [Carboxylicivirga mesophila]MBS2212296.1 mechanosensitive ion channel [Carboxylicivirga mesophila]